MYKYTCIDKIHGLIFNSDMFIFFYSCFALGIKPFRCACGLAILVNVASETDSLPTRMYACLGFLRNVCLIGARSSVRYRSIVS